MEATLDVPQRQFELDPELGLVEIVREKKKVELTEVDADVQVDQAERDDAYKALEDAKAQLAELEASIPDLEAELRAAEVALSTSKSNASRAYSLVGQSPAVDDNGTGATDGFVAVPVQELY